MDAVDDPVLRRRAEIVLGLLATMLAASAALVIRARAERRSASS